jgi:4'-phosphopantetheinyl transferase
MIIYLYLCRVLPDDNRHLARLFDRLDDAERERAGRFVFDRDRRAHAAAHVLLRHALNVEAGFRRWRFAVNAYGKLRLVPACDDIRFSLSHTDGLVAVALAHGQEVGVDVEATTRDPDEASLAAIALAPEEVSDLANFADRRGRLLRLWVAKEALAKAIGIGLSLPLRKVVLRGDPPSVVSMPDGHAPDWWLRTVRHSAHWLALAAEHAPSGHAPSGVVETELTVADLIRDGRSG